MSADHEDEPRGRGEMILLVDDNLDLRRAVMRQLARLGYECRPADNGPDALALIDSGDHFDLLFTDIGLAEGMSGYDLARLARERRPGLPVLFTTGRPGLNDDLDDETGAFPMLRKPYRAEDLGRRVRQALDAAG